MVFGRLIPRRGNRRGGGPGGSGTMMNASQHSTTSSSMVSSAPPPIKMCVDDLNNAIFPVEDRLIAIARAQKLLGGHTNVEQHDEEIILYGAANALWNKLSMATGCHHSAEEIRRICDILADIHQHCNKHAIEHTYNEIGYEILPVIVNVMRLPFADALDPMKQPKKNKDLLDENGNDGTTKKNTEPGEEKTDAGETKDGEDEEDEEKMQERRKEFQKALVKSCTASTDNIKIAVQRCCKVLARYSGIMSEGSARHEMASTINMLQSLMWVIDIHHPLPVEAKCSALAILCNLAQHSSNHIIMASKEPLLLEKICELALIQTPASVGLISVGPNTVVPATTTITSPSGTASTTSSIYGGTGSASTTASAGMTTLAGGEILSEGMIIGIREVSSMTLMHLSYGDEYHIPLIDEKSYVVLDTFSTLLSMDLRRSSTPMIATKIHETRRYSLIGLYNFACGDENCYKLSHHRKGLLLEVLLTVITQPREDHELRVLAMETLYNISCCGSEEESDLLGGGVPPGGPGSTGGSPSTTEPPENALLVAQALGNHPGLPMALGSLVRFQEAPLPIQMCAVKILYRLSQMIHSDIGTDHQCFSLLLSALVQASSWTKTPQIAQAFENLAKNKQHHPDHLRLMTQHLGLLNGISAQALLLIPPPPVQQQQHRTSNVSFFAPDANSITGNSTVTGSTTGDDAMTLEEYQRMEHTLRTIHRSALTTILLLSSLEENRLRLANNEGIMLSLTKASFDPHYQGEQEFGKQIRTVHETLRELVEEL